MTTLADKVILSGADNRPPMLEKDMYDSWKSRMELYMMNRQHGRMILESVKNVHHNVYNPSSSIPQVEYAHSVNQQPDFSQPDSGLIIPVFQKGDDLIDAINHMMSFLTTVVTSRYPPTNNQLRNSSNPRQQATINNGRVRLQPIQGRHTSLAAGTSRTYTSGASGNNSRKQRTVICYNYKGEADDLDAYDSDCDEINTTKLHSWRIYLTMVLMILLSDSNIIPYSQYVSEAQQEAVQNSNFPTQQDALILSVTEQLKTQVVNYTKINLDNKSVNETLTAELERYKDQKAQRLEPKLYDGNVIQKTNAIVIRDSEETLMLAEESCSKMLLKQKDPMMSEKKVNTKSVDYAVLNQLSQDFETRFVPQTELSAEQVFCLKKLKHHLARFDVVVKEGTTATAITGGTWGFEHTKACFRDEIIPFVKALKDLFNSFDQFLIKELSEVQNVFHQMEHAVEQHRSQEKDIVIKKLKERIKSLSGNMKEDKIKQQLEEIETINIELDHWVTKLIAENEHLKQTYTQLYDSIKSSRIRSKEHCDDLIKQVNIKSAENSDLNASVQENFLVITALKDNLRKLKGKAVVDEAVILHLIDPELLKIDVAPLAPKLQNNRTTHYDYLKHTQEEIATLREIVEHERSLNPLNTSLDYACDKLMAVTLMNKTKKVVQIVLWYLDSGCFKHMTGDRSQLTNFVNKFLGMVKFINDHMTKIMGYGDYQIRNVTISRVYFVEGLGHSLFSVRQFCDLDLEVAFRQHTCFIHNLEGVDLLTGSRGNNLYTLSLRDMMASSPICLLSKASKTKSWLWHRCLSHLNFGAINHLARQEAVATTCYTQNRSIIHLRHGKTPYKLLHGKLLDLSFLHVFGALCYLTNNCENLGKLQPKADIAPEVNAPIAEVVAQEPVELTGSPSSTTVDQDAPSPNDLTQSCWIEAMQEELNEFERLEVWELVPRPNKVMVITLKWIYKVKLDELGVDTPMVEKSKLDEDKKGKVIDPSHYRGMIGTLLYLVASRPDLQFAICMCAWSKHIDIRYQFIKEHVENDVIEIYFVNTKYQLADIFTKALGRERIEFLINKLGMESFMPETLKQLTDKVDETMDMIIDQQVALDEALVPHASRLRIQKSNFRLRSDITFKESTLQVVYDVLKLTLFYKAFLVTPDVPEIYMKEF
uniref:Integrase, catalytic region, zinc finger, CCHC-type, peptidase aspartic, catalytic n=1 Tax=Tanacetum cinerariifolium TaxID=118510 RepID=A0A6L2JVH7_TANCI|nr:integrase, catalytic region, zinc finger, CCHC-type, peptidase aspartic, catalytic [Tanacetum cinerariifolium]